MNASFNPSSIPKKAIMPESKISEVKAANLKPTTTLDLRREGGPKGKYV